MHLFIFDIGYSVHWFTTHNEDYFCSLEMPKRHVFLQFAGHNNNNIQIIAHEIWI